MDCNIALTGFMGSGKTSVGKELKKLLPELELIDLDSYIEAMTGMSIPDIFSSEGEDAFRNMEKMALQNIFETNEMLGTQSILALGGGTVMTEACRRMVRRNCKCFYLRGTLDTLAANLKDDSGNRPLLNFGKDLRYTVKKLMDVRGPIYESSAHHIIDIDGKTPTEIAVDIITLL